MGEKGRRGERGGKEGRNGMNVSDNDGAEEVASLFCCFSSFLVKVEGAEEPTPRAIARNGRGKKRNIDLAFGNCRHKFTLLAWRADEKHF